MRFGMFFNQINPTKKSSLSVYIFVDLRLFFSFNVILMRIIHIEIDKKSTFRMIFVNGLKRFDFARQNLDGRAKCSWLKK